MVEVLYWDLVEKVNQKRLEGVKNLGFFEQNADLN